MNIRLRCLVPALLYFFTTTAFAHPGPHSHVGVAEGAWHAFFGWEFWLATVMVGVAWLVIRRLRNTQTK